MIVCLELGGNRALQTGHRAGRRKGDNATHDLLEQQLVDEEEHAAPLETQPELIRQVGLQNYVAAQI